MNRHAFVFALAFVVLAARISAQVETSVLTLDSVFDKGAILEDRNGDGIVDFVDTRIVVPESPSVSDMMAAAEVAARLGYETTATDLPLVVKDSQREPGSVGSPVILIGRRNTWVRRLAEEGRIELGELSAGEGVVRLVPSAFGSEDAVVIVGGDDVGTAAAGRAFASRVPFVGEHGCLDLCRAPGRSRRSLVRRGRLPHYNTVISLTFATESGLIEKRGKS